MPVLPEERHDDGSSLTAEEDPMSAPFIFVATNRLKPGAYEAEHDRVPGLAPERRRTAQLGDGQK
jgi:hypothetical protein